MGELSILGLADDLTGALEVGAKFAASGIESIVAAELVRGPSALVVDTATRHRGGEEAAGRVRALASAACGPSLRLIYKKTDSTLRGNIASELGALRAAFPALPVIYVPAYPRMGRTVKGGRLYVDGVPASESEFARDALNPIRESHIPRLLGSGVSVATLEAVREPDIYVMDGETDRDVDSAAEWLVARGGLALAAGPAAFAEAIAQRLDLPRVPPRPWPRVRNCLVINGSRHELSARQVRHAEACGWRPGWAALPYGEIAGSGLKRAENAGCVVREILNRMELDALVVFGGDTAAGIVKALGQPPLDPIGEIVPGVPVSRMGERSLITKAGGFGAVELLCQIQALLS